MLDREKAMAPGPEISTTAVSASGLASASAFAFASASAFAFASAPTVALATAIASRMAAISKGCASSSDENTPLLDALLGALFEALPGGVRLLRSRRRAFLACLRRRRLSSSSHSSISVASNAAAAATAACSCSDVGRRRSCSCGWAARRALRSITSVVWPRRSAIARAVCPMGPCSSRDAPARSRQRARSARPATEASMSGERPTASCTSTEARAAMRAATAQSRLL
mmetsp:Transcript_86256/g.172211  ORF Transcript_86256/g.172211 Transcript_86256/m.172211 type:complete len:228 (+) Transcript_86256:828-1511(+)